jgi:hypothetical protein
MLLLVAGAGGIERGASASRATGSSASVSDRSVFAVGNTGLSGRGCSGAVEDRQIHCYIGGCELRRVREDDEQHQNCVDGVTLILWVSERS